MEPSSKSQKKSYRRPTSSSTRATKFIPNLTQLQNAAKELPDAQTWNEDTYLYTFSEKNEQRQITFNRLSIQRGDSRIKRWIYEGKVLFRNRDA